MTQPAERTIVREVQVQSPQTTYQSPVKLCDSEYTVNNKSEWKYVRNVTVQERGATYVVWSADGRLLYESPVLIAKAGTSSETGWKDGLLYSRGTGKFNGYYGTFYSDGKVSKSLTIDCKGR